MQQVVSDIIESAKRRISELNAQVAPLIEERERLRRIVDAAGDRQVRITIDEIKPPPGPPTPGLPWFPSIPYGQPWRPVPWWWHQWPWRETTICATSIGELRLDPTTQTVTSLHPISSEHQNCGELRFT